MIGQTLGHYKILDKLGEGGMGVVYLAKDTTLDRNVALKVLPANLAESQERLDRFQREAKTLAALDHPNIVHIYSVEEAEGVRFLTMQLVEGEALSELIPKRGMPLERIFDIAIPLADALASAHEKGVIHRDLKPANIMVTDEGRVKVLDFGLAKLRQETEVPIATQVPTEPLTEEGRVLGTAPYMSPEQLQGKGVDHRTDIFSLGILMHEMARGERPFQGESSMEVASSILKDTPPLVTEQRPELPRHLGRVLAHCLEKEPQRRYQSALDIRNELEGLRDEVRTGSITHTSGRGKGLWIGLVGAAIVAATLLAFVLGRAGQAPEPEVTSTPPSESATSATPASAANSIAVLPFADMSPNQDQEYFSDGISEELLNLLAKIPELRVTSRSSAFSFKGKDLEIPEIASRLNVAHILEGSVRKAGNQVRITAQLIEAGSDTHMWSETYDRTLDDIFALQDEIAADVVAQLKVTLLGDMPKVQETDSEAYSLLLQSRQVRDQANVEAVEKAIGLLEQALAIDPEYAAAWSDLSRLYLGEAIDGLGSQDEAYGLALEAVNKALGIDPEFAPPHARLGLVAAVRDNNLEAAARHIERALSLEPTNLEVIRYAGLLSGVFGRLDEAIELFKFVVARDPVSVRDHFSLGECYMFAERWDEAIASWRTVMVLGPGNDLHELIGIALLHKGDPEAAVAAVQQGTWEPARLKGLALAYHALGQHPESGASLAELIEKYEQGWAYDIANVLAFRGEADRAFEWLDKAVEYKERNLYRIVNDQLFNNIHSDPRWLPFLESLGKSPEQLAAIEFDVALPE